LTMVGARSSFAFCQSHLSAPLALNRHRLCKGNKFVAIHGLNREEAVMPYSDTIHDHACNIGFSLGHRIHSMRESREWTLEMLAEQTGLSRAYLSRLAAGDRQPSLAGAFGVSIAALFERSDQRADCVVVRGGSTSPKAANGLTFHPLSSSTKPFNIHPIAVTIPHDRAGGQVYQHDGEEWLYVTAGRVKLTINRQQHILEAGDAAHYDSRLPHRLDAMHGADAGVILVACPIPLTLTQARESADADAEWFVG